MRIALIGQPNCGKSTLFNQVAGYKAETGNFAGTTVTYTESKVRVLGKVIDLVDLPGTYSLTGTNPAERETLRYLTSNDVDVIVNVLDATHLVQGFGLTLELLELGRPLVLALNMMDEAARLGMKIDFQRLESILGVPVVPLVASKGRGVRRLFTTVVRLREQESVPQRPHYALDVEEAIRAVCENMNGRGLSLQGEALAIKLLEGDEDFISQVEARSPHIRSILVEAQRTLEEARGQAPVWVISAERHGMAGLLTKQVMIQGERRVTWRDRLDDVLLHPLWGYLALVVILLIFFQVIFGLGSALEGPLLAIFDSLILRLEGVQGSPSLFNGILIGVLQGIAGGVAIVLPYLLPFLLGLGFLEDIGYLPRIAFLMDALMHRIGLHGKAIVPFILGYGCNVPAVMSTRILEDRRDRFLAAMLSTLVPCAARLAVVFGLVAFYLGPYVALGIYLFNLFVIALTGRIISALLPEDTPGLILEMPVYRLPTLRTVVHKVWFRVREFVVEAWPILIVGSAILAVLEYFNLARFFNLLVRPVTWALGLPDLVGVPLIFGILRKELSLVMLRQALNVSDFSVALSPVQMISFTVFVVFYVPCLATLAVLRRELGNRDMLMIAGATIVIAFLAAIFARLFALPFYL